MSFYERTVTRNYRRLRWALTSRAKKKQLEKAAIEYIRQDAEASAMLDLARKDGVTIEFDPGLTGTTALARYSVDFGSGTMKIAVNPYLTSGAQITPEKLAPALVHELRHHWQYKKIGVTPKTGNRLDGAPRLSFIFNRVAEADAYAFEDRFVHLINAQNEITTRALDDVIALGEPAQPEKTIDALTEIMNRQIDETVRLHKNVAAQQRADFIRYLSDKNLSDSYDPTQVLHLHNYHTASITVSVRDVKPVTLADLKKVSASYLGPISDAKFEEMTLGHAHPLAAKTVDLMEQFRAAVANDNKKEASQLRRQATQNIKKLAKISN